MDIKQRAGAKGIYGTAQIRINKNVVLVKFDDGGEYSLALSDCPQGVKPGKWSVALSSKGDRMFSFRPLKGTFKASFLKFAAPEGTPPAPFTEESRWKDKKTGQWKTGDVVLMFNAIILVDGQYEYPVKLPYRFEKDENGNATISYVKLGVRVQKLIDLLDVTGVKDLEFKYTENILPELEKAMQENAEEFLVVVDEGWINSFAAPLVPSKKPAKKKPAAKKK